MYSSDNDDLDETSPISPSGEIYQRIESLFEQADQQSSSDCDLMTMWGLHTPRGPFVPSTPTYQNNNSVPQSPVGFGRRKFQSSTPFGSHSHYKSAGYQSQFWMNFDNESEDDITTPSPLRSFHRNFDSGFHSTPNSPMVMRKNPSMNHYNFDCSSPLGDSAMNMSSRSLSPPESWTDSGITELMSSMNLNTSYQPEQEYSPLQGIEPLQFQIKRLQQQQLNFQASVLSFIQQQQYSSSNNLFHSPTVEGNGNSLERAAFVHKTAAAVHEAPYTWSGTLPPHTTERNAIYSCKVFLGGIPWDISEEVLEQVFALYGPVRVVWPGKEQMASQPKGFAYLIFESEKKLKALLAICTKDFVNGSWFYRISSRRMKAKSVEVIPWAIADCNYAKTSCQKLDPQKTVFVGALHGMITAEGLALIMGDLFGEVLYAGIDTDKHRYPIGSARVTFGSTRSYMKAVAAAFIEIKTEKFTKTIQVDPYLEDTFCSSCKIQQGPYFCREMICFRYFCRQCWQMCHALENKNHKPLMRNSKSHQIIGFGSPGSSPSQRL